MSHLSISPVRADALFASGLQPSAEPSVRMRWARTAVTATFGGSRPQPAHAGKARRSPATGSRSHGSQATAASGH